MNFIYIICFRPLKSCSNFYFLQIEHHFKNLLVLNFTPYFIKSWPFAVSIQDISPYFSIKLNAIVSKLIPESEVSLYVFTLLLMLFVSIADLLAVANNAVFHIAVSFLLVLVYLSESSTTLLFAHLKLLR